MQNHEGRCDPNLMWSAIVIFNGNGLIYMYIGLEPDNECSKQMHEEKYSAKSKRIRDTLDWPSSTLELTYEKLVNLNINNLWQLGN